MFSIQSSETVSENDQQYVSYRLCVRQENDKTDSNNSVVCRRYTHFSVLYNDLKKEFPTLMSGVDFPKKVITGNFTNELTCNRSRGFERLLNHIAKESRLREAECTVRFFQNIELEQAKKLMSENDYDKAFFLLENIFTLLNKIYMDRSRVVLIALCRIVACGEQSTLLFRCESWVSLALRRFDGVSDTDLLSLYVPLMRACISMKKKLDQDSEMLENTLNDMKRRGMRVENTLSLMETIEKLEK